MPVAAKKAAPEAAKPEAVKPQQTPEPVAPGTTEVKMVAKLSAANAGVPSKRLLGLNEDVKMLALAWIMGECEGSKAVDDPTQGKTHYPLVGRFQSINAETGVKTQSGVLYLPAGIHDTYLAAANKLQDGELLKFAIELRAVRSSSPAGYGYEAVNLLKAKSIDPLDEMIQEIAAGGKTLKLAAPKK